MDESCDHDGFWDGEEDEFDPWTWDSLEDWVKHKKAQQQHPPSQNIGVMVSAGHASASVLDQEMVHVEAGFVPVCLLSNVSLRHEVSIYRWRKKSISVAKFEDDFSAVRGLLKSLSRFALTDLIDWHGLVLSRSPRRHLISIALV